MTSEGSDQSMYVVIESLFYNTIILSKDFYRASFNEAPFFRNPNKHLLTHVLFTPKLTTLDCWRDWRVYKEEWIFVKNLLIEISFFRKAIVLCA